MEKTDTLRLVNERWELCISANPRPWWWVRWWTWFLLGWKWKRRK